MLTALIKLFQFRRSFTPGYRPASLAEGEPFLQLADLKWIFGGLNGQTQIDVPFASMGGGGSGSYTLPIATATTLGGVKANAGTAGQFVSGIDPATGNLIFATPAGGSGNGSPFSVRRARFSSADGNIANGQTTFTIPGGYTVGNVLVVVDRVVLTPGTGGDYTATNGTTISISTPAIETTDVVDVVMFDGTVAAGASYTLPAATSTALGGIKTGSPATGKFVSGFDTDGTALYATPASGGSGPASTDALPEGTTNLYFTQARARAALSVSGSLSYSASTGVLSYTTPSTDGVAEGTSNLYFTAARSRGAISVSGSLAYNATTGVISYTAPALAAVATSGSASDLTAGTLPTARLPSVGTAGTYGSGSQIPVITTDGYGRVTGVTLAANAGGGGSSYTLPAATASALGGIKTGAPGSGKFVSGFDTDGTALYAVPAGGGTGGALTLTRQVVTPTAGQTVFPITGGYTPGNILVFVDATVPVNGVDYTATNGTSVTINAPALGTSDVVEFVIFSGGSVSGGSGPSSTDALPEGTSNLYFTQARARASVSAAGSLSYNASTGVFSYTAPTLAAVATSGSASDLTAGTLPSARLPAFTGDVTSSAGSAALTLAASGVTAGSFTNANITVDAKGRITAAANAALTGDVTTSVGSLATTIATGAVTFAKIATAAVSAASDIFANAASKLVSVAALWGAQAWTTIASSATPAIDGSTGVNFKITLTANATFQTPTNMKAGQSGLIKITQDATGGRTGSWSTGYTWGGAGAPTLSTGANKSDYVAYYFDADTSLMVMGVFQKSA